MIYQLRLLLKQTLILRLSNVSSLFYLQFVQCLWKTNQHQRGCVLSSGLRALLQERFADDSFYADRLARALLMGDVDGCRLLYRTRW